MKLRKLLKEPFFNKKGTEKKESVFHKIGERLREVRVNMGLTQKDFAELGGVKTLAQTNYERGVRYPTLEYLIELEKSGVNTHFVIFGKFVDINKISVTENELLYAYRHGGKDEKLAMEFVANIGKRER